MDEESRFSSVLRPSEDNIEEYEDTNGDIHNHETFTDLFPNIATPTAAAGSKHGFNTVNLREAESGRFNRPDLIISSEVNFMVVGICYNKIS